MWVGVGGSPQSVIRAARYGLPLMLAVIGGPPIRFAPLVELYKRALDKYGYPPLKIGMHSHGLVARTDQEAVDIQWPHWAHVFENAAAERGWARPTMARFLAEVEEGSLYLGSVETVATKIAWVIRLLGLSRFDLAYATGRVPHEQKMATIELYGREVIPRVRGCWQRQATSWRRASRARRQRTPEHPVSSSQAADRRLGIVGAGKIGTAIARAAVAGGYDVAISGSGPAERIELIVEVLAPGARAVSTDEVVRYADLIVLAVPMHRFRELPRDLFAGKILVDAMNYWDEIDGVDEELATAPAGTSAVVQEWFSSARVVKSLNHLGYFKFEKSRRPKGTPGRLAIAAVGDDRAAVAAVLLLIDGLGFDAVNAGGLPAGLALQPDGPVFGAGHSAQELSNLLSREGTGARP